MAGVKTAIVTGGAGDLGVATALRLVQDGFRIGVLDLDPAAVRNTLTMLSLRVWILLVAGSMCVLAVVIASGPVAIVGIVLMVVGLAAGKVLAMAGFGASKPGRPGTGTVVR